MRHLPGIRWGASGSGLDVDVRRPRGTRAGKPRRRNKRGRKIGPEMLIMDADADVFGGVVGGQEESSGAEMTGV